MKVIIAGSREGFSQRLLDEAMENCGFVVTEVVSGGARGVDRLGEAWAGERGIDVTQFIPDWNGPTGKAAGHVRNRQMGDYADAAVVLWDGQSKGSKGMIDYMKKLGKPCHVYGYGL